jgi:hypothetical protein
MIMPVLSEKSKHVIYNVAIELHQIPSYIVGAADHKTWGVGITLRVPPPPPTPMD